MTNRNPFIDREWIHRLTGLGGPGSGYKDHPGRPGKEGGSLPGGAGGTVRFDPQRKGSAKRPAVSTKAPDTTQKLANGIGKILGKRVSKALGGDYYSVMAPKKYRTPVENALTSWGFEKYEDEYKQPWVVSYKKDNFRVHLNDRDMGAGLVNITISETRNVSIPMD